ncbi:MAG: RHS repeat-associated core domain-containing protein [Acidobacteria bacterium]|nr:RHS repeat-associated core domain-containing protein [Acidobacteriota bacterium]
MSFTYDDNGNLTSDGARSYTWDARNQLAAISGGTSASFGYDGFGRRRSRTLGGVTRGFLYDGLNPVQELSGGSPVANLLAGRGLDEYLTRTDSSGTVSYLTDALGSTVALADGSAAVQTEYTYEPFGGTSVSGTSTGSAFGFAGRENDGTGLYFYRARYYDSRTQRFLAEDPIGFLGGDINLYGYVWNEPTGYTDPTGLAVIMPPPGCRGRSGKNPPAWVRFLCSQIPYLPFPLIGAGAATATAGSGGAAGAGAGASAATAISGFSRTDTQILNRAAQLAREGSSA